MRSHEARHGLPISNGYGGSSSYNENHVEVARTYSVWCGRCQDYFAPDPEWVERYFASRLNRIAREEANGYLTRGQILDARDGIAQDKAALLKWLGVST